MNRRMIAIQVPTDWTWEMSNVMLSYVSEERQARCKRFVHDKDRIASLYSELLARAMIAQFTNRRASQIAFGKNEYGKPYPLGISDIDFNISHSGKWVLGAVSQRPIGVDVERIHPINETALAERFFAPVEAEMLNGIQQDEARKKRFYQIWSLKESYIKWKGTGLSTSLSSFSFRFDLDEQLHFQSDHPDCCYFHIDWLDEAHPFALCSSDPWQQAVEIETIHPADLHAMIRMMG
ncbi:4'-phosphopantetheinyl transferase family protein [Marinicrinis sediminis]|uniref:4'-phosphopantetheinyl transferase family protein n=1 Tax=Marinicrinis sediminis TaxID=1652465 RepID=A0ABW5RDS4_9BACL